MLKEGEEALEELGEQERLIDRPAKTREGVAEVDGEGGGEPLGKVDDGVGVIDGGEGDGAGGLEGFFDELAEKGPGLALVVVRSDAADTLGLGVEEV